MISAVREGRFHLSALKQSITTVYKRRKIKWEPVGISLPDFIICFSGRNVAFEIKEHMCGFLTCHVKISRITCCSFFRFILRETMVTGCNDLEIVANNIPTIPQNLHRPDDDPSI